MAGTTNRYISEEEYVALMQLSPSLGETEKLIIHEVMVKKRKQTELADSTGKSRQLVNQLIARHWKKYQASKKVVNASKGINNLPEGWNIMTVAAPDFMLRGFLQEVKNYMRKHDIQVDNISPTE